jgi:hypothetical protein
MELTPDQAGRLVEMERAEREAEFRKRAFERLDDLFITRDDEGEIVTLAVETITFGRKVGIKPMTLGQSMSYPDRAKSVAEFEPEEKARLIREHVVEPDCSGLTDDQIIEGMDPMTVDDLVMTISLYSGPKRKEAEAAAKKKKGTKT